jgi:hypothetical protein
MPGSKALQGAPRIGNAIGAVPKADPETGRPVAGRRAMARGAGMIEIADVHRAVLVDRSAGVRIGNPDPRHPRCPILGYR